MENKLFNIAGGRHYGNEIEPRPLKPGEKYLVLSKQNSELSL
jgi:hypothetical protein